MTNFQVVIAWTEEHFEPVGQWRHDLGERPNMRAVSVPKAAMWKAECDQTDIDKATKYAASNGHHVFVVSCDESDPLGKAKAWVATI